MMETPKSQGQSINEREKVSTVHDEALISKPDTWGSGFKKLYLVCGLVYLCSTMNGLYSPNIHLPLELIC